MQQITAAKRQHGFSHNDRRRQEKRPFCLRLSGKNIVGIAYALTHATCPANHILLPRLDHFYVCMYKGWAIKLALAPRPLMIYCASPLTAAMIITIAALRIVIAHGSKPT
jgi:hypothetical protein